MLHDGVQLTQGSKVVNLTVDNGAVFPAIPDLGELFFRTDTQLLYIYDSTGWTPVATTINAGNLPGNTLAPNIIYSSLTTVGTLVSLGVTGGVTAASFSGSGAGLTSIPNVALINSSLTIGSTTIALGATSTSLAGLVSVTSSSFVGALTGNADTATTATNLAAGLAGNIVYQSAAGTTAMLGTGTSSQVLVSGTTPSWTNTPTLTGTNFTGIPNGALTNSTITIGTTSVSLGATAGSLAGLLSVTATTFSGAFNGPLTGNATSATNIAGGLAGNIPYQTGAGATAMLGTGTSSQVLVSGVIPSWTNAPTLTGTNFTGIPNGALTNNTITIGTTVIALGETATNLNGLTGVAATTFTGALVGNASTATTLQTARTISGVSFNGSANIVVPTIYDAAYKAIFNPGGGIFTTVAPTFTGAIRVVLPTSTTAAFSITFKVTDNGGETSFEVHCGGYFDSTLNQWTGAFGYLVGNATANLQFAIRLGFNGTKPVIYVGELATVWSAPQIFVTECLIGQAGQSVAYTTGWLVGFEATAFQGVTYTRLNPQVGAIVARTLWGQSFDGTANVSGDLTTVGNITGTAGITLTATGATLNLATTGTNPIIASPNGLEKFRVGGAAAEGVGIGSTTLTARGLVVANNLTGATTAVSVHTTNIVQSDVTAASYGFRSSLGTQAAAFTLNSLLHFAVVQGAIGAGSAVTNQTGFDVAATMVGAASNYGFRGQIPAGAGRWNLYMDGTADNYLAGGLTVGGAITASGGTANGVAYLNASKVLTSGVALTFDGTKALTIGDGTATLRASATVNGGANAGVGAGFFVNIAGVQAGGLSNSGYAASDTSTDLAIYAPAGKSIRAYANGAEAWRTDTSGRLIVGATAGTAKLNVVETATGEGLRVDGAAGGFSMIVYGGTDRTSRIRALSIGAGYVATTPPANSLIVESGVGIGATSLTARGLVIGNSLTGSTVAVGAYLINTLASDVTSSAFGFRSDMTTAAAVFTLATLNHFHAQPPASFGAGSVVTAQAGFNVASTLTGATNNYGFRSQIPAGANRYNLYMDGTADNYLAGPLGIGSTSLTARGLVIGNALTGSATAISNFAINTISSDVTGSAYGFRSSLSTQAAAFTLGELIHFTAAPGTIGAGSTVTAQTGYLVTAALTGATNNYAFRSQIAAGTGRYNLYMDGTAANYLAGNLSIGNTTVTSVFGTTLRVGATSNGGTVEVSGGRIYSPATENNLYVSGGIGTNGNIIFNTAGDAVEHVRFDNVGDVLIGGTSKTTPQTLTRGVYLQSTGASDVIGYSLYTNDGVKSPRVAFFLDNATSTFGVASTFSSTTPSFVIKVGANVEKFRVGGSGSEGVGIGTTSLIARGLAIGTTLTGATAAFGVYSASTIASDVTGSTHAFRSQPNTQAAAFTLAALYHFSAVQGSIGAGSAISAQTGFIADASLIGATNNYGFRGAIPAGTNRYNLYMDGTAQNYLAGWTGFGKTVPDSTLHVYENNANANLGVTIEQAGTGDAVLQFLLTGVRRWMIGVDHSDADKLKIGTGADLSTSSALVIDVNSNVGIGSTNDSSYSKGSASDFSVAKATTWTTISARSYSVGSASGGLLVLGKSRSATVGTLVETLTSDTLGYITAEGVNVSSANRWTSAILFQQDGAATATFIPGRIILQTGSATADVVEKFRLTSDGTTTLGGLSTAPAFKVSPITGQVNYLRANSASTANPPYLFAEGADANVSFGFYAKGSGSHVFSTNGSAAIQLEIVHTAGATNRLKLTGSNAGAPKIDTSAGSLQLAAAGVIGATLDTSGNLGLGVTPSAWTTYKAFQFGQGGALWANPGAAADVFLSANYTFSASTDTYITTGFATYYRQLNGAHIWATAPSGLAGNPITFTQVMTLDTIGNLGLGVTPSAHDVTGSGGPIFQLKRGVVFGSNAQVNLMHNAYYATGNYRYMAAAAATAYEQANGSHSWYAAPVGTVGAAVAFTQTMTLDTAGRLGLGVTPNAWDATRTVLQFGPVGFLRSDAGSVSEIGVNSYFNGTHWLYQTTNGASRFSQSTGAHYWFTAPSGIAGATTTITSGQTYTVTTLGGTTLAQWQAFFSGLSVLPTVGQVIVATATGTLLGGATVTQTITFAQSMILDASGNLGVGVTPAAWNASSYKIMQVGNASFAGSTTVGTIIVNSYYDGTNWRTISTGGTAGVDFSEYGVGWSYSATAAAGSIVSRLPSMTLVNSTGALELGSGPSPVASWTSPALNVGYASFSGDVSGSAPDVRISANTYLTGSTWQYAMGFVGGERAASQYAQSAGNHTWSTAVAGVADAPITWLEKLRLDTNGVLALGSSTPQIWAAAEYRVVEFGGSGFLMHSPSGVTSWLTTNTYLASGGWTRVGAFGAVGYNQTTAGHNWYTAASGTAGSTFTWTNAMALDLNRNLMLGVTAVGTAAVNVIGIGNGTAPTTSPAGMGQLYVEAGALKYRGSSGTITTLGVA